MRGLAIALSTSVLLWCASSCTLLRPLHGLGCEAGAGDASCIYGEPCATAADCATTACTDERCQCPMDMVTIESAFCIDRTEVSNGAYRAFLATGPDVHKQAPYCFFNTSFDFDLGVDVCKSRKSEDEFPASCVDWCDAKAFCEHLGKRLCGKLHGGSLPDEGYKDAKQSEWFDACSKGGALEYPTGSFDATQCRGNGMAPQPVSGRTVEVCEGGYSGLENMSGNVREWEDSCTDAVGPDDRCLTRGGAFDSGGDKTDLRCDTHDQRERSDTDVTIGFRCCSG